MTRHVRAFAAGLPGDDAPSSRFGAKGAALIELGALGIPVPPGFVLASDGCEQIARAGGLDDSLRAEIDRALLELERRVSRRFGEGEHPLLLAVRPSASPGARVPVDTVLDVGASRQITDALARTGGGAWFALDVRRRFVAGFGETVLGVPRRVLEALLDGPRRAVAEERGVHAARFGVEELRARIPDSAIPVGALRDALARSIALLEQRGGRPPPEAPRQQLEEVLVAIARACGALEGGACIVQAMVLGNLGARSGTGLCSSRDRRTGEPGPSGEWMPGVQGEDVASGRRSPTGISRRDAGERSLEATMPEVYAEVVEICARLERSARDLVELELTVEEGVLHVLESRAGPRSARAAVRVAVDLVREGLVDRDTALLRIDAERLTELLHATIDPDALRTVLATGLAAAPGAATGVVVFTADEAVALASTGKSVILVRRETSPEDLAGMKVAAGVLTARGGLTSHAAVVARIVGNCCVAGCMQVTVDPDRRLMKIARVGPDGRALPPVVVQGGDTLTLHVDGKAGQVLAGEVPMILARPTEELAQLLAWADEARTLGVRANADSEVHARTARSFGAEGVGLCRTEHTLFEPTRLALLRTLLVAEAPDARRPALDALLPIERADFAGIFRVMGGLPVTVRLLDAPLHEFLPDGPGPLDELARSLGCAPADVGRRVASLRETNPMLGHRGVRLAMTTPDVYDMQLRALFEAACDVEEEGIEVHLEILVPLVMIPEELSRVRERAERIRDEIDAARGRRVSYVLGAMIELPRAALVAGQLAAHVEFFSFGTNDLTQTTLGLSRDDAGRFLPEYERSGLVPGDPFQTLDVDGVGELVRLAADRGRAARPSLGLGVCGEQGGDPASIRFFHELGVSYVSSSPFRVPIARLAAAQAAILSRRRAGGAPV